MLQYRVNALWKSFALEFNGMQNTKFFPLSLVLLMFWAMPALGQVVVDFPTTNDSYINNLEPNLSFGSQNGMMIGAKDGANGSICHSYVQFDMSGYDGDIVESAILRLYVGETAPSDMPQTFSLYQGAGDSWSQDSLTWNNAPGYLPDVLDVRTNTFNPGWVSFDVTSVVSDVSEVGGKISFVFVQNSGPLGSWLSFTTSEWAPRDNQRPHMEIRFEGTVPVESKTLDEMKAIYLTELK